MNRQPPADDRDVPRCYARDRLARAMDLMVEQDSDQVLVVGHDGQPMGVLTAQDALKVWHLLGAERAAELRVANALRLVLSRQGSGVRPRPVAPDEDVAFPLVRPRAEAPADAEPLPLVTVRASSTRDTEPRSDDGDATDPLMRAFVELEQLPRSQTPLQGLAFATRLLFELVPSEAAFGYLYDVDRDVLRVAARCGATDPVRDGDEVPRGAGLIELALRYLCPPLRVAGARGHRAFDAAVDVLGPEPRTALYMPIEHDGTLLGLLQLVNRRNAPAFDEGDGSLAAYVGQRLGDFLHQTRLSLLPTATD